MNVGDCGSCFVKCAKSPWRMLIVLNPNCTSLIQDQIELTAQFIFIFLQNVMIPKISVKLVKQILCTPMILTD